MGVCVKRIGKNLTYENRSTKSIILVDHWVYNIGDSTLIPTELKPLHTVGPFEFYDDVKVLIDNYSKYKGIGVSMRFKKPDDKYLIICIRQDIYKSPHYFIGETPPNTTPADIYNQCDRDLTTQDFLWGSDLVVKNRLDPQGFQNYNFAGIISFHDPK